MSIIPTVDGGYALTGFVTNGTNGQDLCIIKLFGNLDFSWSKTYGGSNMDAGFCIKQNGSDYVIAGATFSSGAGGEDIYSLSVKSDGTTCNSSNNFTPIGGNPSPVSVNTVSSSIKDVTSSFQQTDVSTQSGNWNCTMNTICSGQ